MTRHDLRRVGRAGRVPAQTTGGDGDDPARARPGPGPLPNVPVQRRSSPPSSPVAAAVTTADRGDAVASCIDVAAAFNRCATRRLIHWPCTLVTTASRSLPSAAPHDQIGSLRGSRSCRTLFRGRSSSPPSASNPLPVALPLASPAPSRSLVWTYPDAQRNWQPVVLLQLQQVTRMRAPAPVFIRWL